MPSIAFEPPVLPKGAPGGGVTGARGCPYGKAVKPVSSPWVCPGVLTNGPGIAYGVMASGSGAVSFFKALDQFLKGPDMIR